jgi:hypothetical protein
VTVKGFTVEPGVPVPGHRPTLPQEEPEA